MKSYEIKDSVRRELVDLFYDFLLEKRGETFDIFFYLEKPQKNFLQEWPGL